MISLNVYTVSAKNHPKITPKSAQKVTQSPKCLLNSLPGLAASNGGGGTLRLLNPTHSVRHGVSFDVGHGAAAGAPACLAAHLGRLAAAIARAVAPGEGLGEGVPQPARPLGAVLCPQRGLLLPPLPPSIGAVGPLVARLGDGAVDGVG